VKHKALTTPSQRLCWAIAAVISLTAHAGLLVFISQSLERPNRSAAAASVPSRSMSVRVLPGSPVSAGLAPAELPAAPNPAAPNKPPDANPALPKPETTPIEARKPGMSDLRFFSIDEVDQAALPVLDWHLPDKIAASLKLRRLVVEMWIADNGQLLDMAIVSSRPRLSREQELQIVESLMQTEMAPAIRQGNGVPSRRTLEMGFDSGSP
jgi:hypothetical protein